MRTRSSPGLSQGTCPSPNGAVALPRPGPKPATRSSSRPGRRRRPDRCSVRLASRSPDDSGSSILTRGHSCGWSTRRCSSWWPRRMTWRSGRVHGRPCITRSHRPSRTRCRRSTPIRVRRWPPRTTSCATAMRSVAGRFVSTAGIFRNGSSPSWGWTRRRPRTSSASCSRRSNTARHRTAASPSGGTGSMHCCPAPRRFATSSPSPRRAAGTTRSRPLRRRSLPSSAGRPASTRSRPERGSTDHLSRSPVTAHRDPPPRATESHDRGERVTVGHRQCSQAGMVRTVDFAYSDEQIAIRNTARDFIADDIITREAAALRRERQGLSTPEEYGGRELPAVTEALLWGETGRSFIPFRFGGEADNILYHANDEQTAEYLVPTIEGDRLSCFAITEPDAGSDAANIKTSARPDGDDWLINGEKTFITGGNDADFAIVIAVTDADKGAREGSTAFLVDRAMGWTSQFIPTMGEGGPASLVFEDVRVPHSNVLGEVGQGFALGMEWIGRGRYLIPARALGAAERLLQMAIDYANTRETFGRKIGANQAI